MSNDTRLRGFVCGGLASAFGLVLLVYLIPEHVEPDPDLRLPVETLPQILAWVLIALGACLAWFESGSDGDSRTNDVAGERKVILVFGLLTLASVALIWLPFLLVFPPLLLLLGAMRAKRLNTVILLAAVIGPPTVWAFVTFVIERPLP